MTRDEYMKASMDEWDRVRKQLPDEYDTLDKVVRGVAELTAALAWEQAQNEEELTEIHLRASMLTEAVATISLRLNKIEKQLGIEDEKASNWPNDDGRFTDKPGP